MEWRRRLQGEVSIHQGQDLEGRALCLAAIGGSIVSGLAAGYEDYFRFAVRAPPPS